MFSFHKLRLILFFGLIFLHIFWESANSQDLEWQSFTSVGVIQDIDVKNGVVWSGSNGGALQMDISRGEFTKFTNTEGLSGNEIVAVEIDDQATVWFALADGVLNRYFPETDSWHVINEYPNEVITDLVSVGDSLYVGLDTGVSLFIISKNEVKETYLNFGFSRGKIVEKVRANSVFISSRDIWVATDRGLAQASLSKTNLQAPDNWTKHTTQNGLLTNIVHEVVVRDTIPFAATNVGVMQFVEGRWQKVGTLNANVLSIDVAQPNSLFSQATIVILTSTGVFYLDASGQWLRLGASLNDISAFKADDLGNVWIGRKDKGLAKINFEFNPPDWQLFETNSPASNNFKGLALDAKNRLWCASQGGGIHMWDGQNWRNWSRNDDLKSDDQRTVLVDSSGRIWFGSWGGGITIFEEASDNFTISKIDTTDGILAGSDTPAFVLITNLIADRHGNIWIVNRQANNARVLAVNTPDNRYQYFSSTFQEIGTPFIMTMEIDNADRVWIGTEDRGIKVIDYGSTLFDKNDDDYSQGLNTSEGLFSNKITALKEDRDGVMWIGSEEGVNKWFQGMVRNEFGLINDFVNTIGVDARNNKWFGTANGVSVLSNDGVSWTHYTTGNSPLVSGNVLSFAFNFESGEVWIGTSNGLSRLKTPFTASKQNLSLLSGYPNPFVIDRTNKVFTITNLAENTKVVIYNATGSIVKTFKPEEIPGARVEWDGKNEKNQFVASGIYVYLAFTDTGVSAAGKVAVIRK
ncbi:MAG: two-component regulator propeller domain-containing protein [bacterium]